MTKSSNPLTLNTYRARTKKEWQDLGYHWMVAAALEGNEKSLYDVVQMSDRELIELALEWEGIIGYTESLIELITCPRFGVHNAASK